MRVRPVLIGVLLLLVLPAPAGATTSGGVVLHRVDAMGCIRPPAGAGRVIVARRLELAAASLLLSGSAANRCQSEAASWNPARPWRTGYAMIGRRPVVSPAHLVPIEVRRDAMTQAEDWLITRIDQHEIRIQANVDQCYPGGRVRVVETDAEIRIRYSRAYSRSTTCTAVGFFSWGPERVLKLKQPLGGRTIVAELESVSNQYLDESCQWVQGSLRALIDDSSASERARLAGTDPSSSTTQEYEWTKLLVEALKLPDDRLRARIGRGIRRDMRRLAYPDDCSRSFTVPAIDSNEPTRFVYGGHYLDADVVGVDISGRVTWSTRLDGAALALDTCPDGTTGLLVERTPDVTWPTEARIRVRTIDLATGAVSDPQSLRRFTLSEYGDDDLGFSVVCTGAGSGWIQTGRNDYAMPASQVFIDELWPGGSRRVTVPADVGAGILGDGFLVTQTYEPKDPYLSEPSVPGRLVRYDLRTGTKVTGPLLASQAYMYLSADGHLATDHGPIRLWDVSSSGFRFLFSHADPRRGMARESAAWAEDGSLRYMSTNLEATPQAGTVYRMSPIDGSITALDVVSRGQMDLIVADRGQLFTFDEHGSAENDGGLQTWDTATMKWRAFSSSLDRGSTTFFEPVRP